MRHTRAILAMAGTALLVVTCAACRSLPATAAVSPEDIQAARACGLSSEDCRRLGEDLSILLSLVQADVLQKEDIQRAATALLGRPDAPWPMETYAVAPDGGTVRLGDASLPLPNDHVPEPRGPTTYSVWHHAAWLPDGPLAIPPEPRPANPIDTSELLALLPNRGACYQLITAPAAWRLSSILELPKVSLPETEAGSAAPPLGLYAYLGLDAPGFGLDAGLVMNPQTGRWDVFTWRRTQDETVWRQAPSLAGLTEVPPGKDGTQTLWGMKVAPGWTLLSRDYVQGTRSCPASPDPTVWVYLPAVPYRNVIVEIRGE